MKRRSIRATRCLGAVAIVVSALVALAQNDNRDGRPPEPPASENSSDVNPPPPETPAPTVPAPPETTPSTLLRSFQIIRPVGRYGRTPFHQDAIEARLVRGDFNTPKSGDEVATAVGKAAAWHAAEADDDGWLASGDLRGGYAVTTLESPAEKGMILHAEGHSAVYVNGLPRTGDPYGTGFVRLPVQLRKGENQFLFHVGTGRMRAELASPSSDALLDMADATLPDLIAGETQPMWGAVVVVNATAEPLAGAMLVCRRAGGEAIETPIATLPPLSIHKAPFEFEAAASASDKKIEFEIRLIARSAEEASTDSGDSNRNGTQDIASSAGEKPSGEPKSSPTAPLAAATFSLPVVDPAGLHKRTFRSKIDNSVQYFAVRPGEARSSGRHGLILTLHGAGVEATKQAAQYTAKNWAHVVAPTNRRPFGFDWEDWGRLDALEVLELAKKRFDVDPHRVCLTGHSMGGHGAWHLGVNYPGTFAAIAPSAGWVSFSTYGSAPRIENPTPIEQMLLRGSSPGDTTLLAENLRAAGVFVLHGSEDKNVPVREARRMRNRLGMFHTNFTYFEKPQAGHWWGRECCDWPPMMRFLESQRTPDFDDVRRISFTTASPGVAPSMYWLSIEMQKKPFVVSRVDIECDPDASAFVGKTKNVTRLALDVTHLNPSNPIRVKLDGQELGPVRWPGLSRKLRLARKNGIWRIIRKPPANAKRPGRYGAFKDVFRNRAVLVFGTHGDDEENRWAAAKARYDAESFWYRGNGALKVLPDTDFDAKAFHDRNVVLYGNAATNAAWPKLLSTAPVQVRRGTISIGNRRESGDDLACLFILPKSGSDVASVGVVSGTGIDGMRLTNRLRYFVSGVAYPDLAIFGADVLTKGTTAVRVLGYFGEDWKIDSGDFAWRDVAL